jgi:hypothetical protein
MFHTLVAKLLYLCKRTQPDIHTAVAFLTTCVSKPDIHDYNKLCRCMWYLRGTSNLPLTLETQVPGKIEWYVDASFAVHPDMRSHTGAILSLGGGTAYSMSTWQKINTKSSTEAELVGIDDAMLAVCWTRNFLSAQGISIHDNVIYQDNHSAILLATNGQASSGKQTRHINIRYFIKDRIAQKEFRIAYCPTGVMLSDILTKPLQGSQFRMLRDCILNIKDISTQITTPISLTPNGSQECVEALNGTYMSPTTLTWPHMLMTRSWSQSWMKSIQWMVKNGSRLKVENALSGSHNLSQI